MKKTIVHDTLEALLSDSTLHELRGGAGRRRMVDKAVWTRMAICALQERTCVHVGVA